MIRAWKEWPNMSSSMDKSPGYETRDANTRGVLGFLIVLGIVLVFTAIVCWGMFKYYSASRASLTPASPFSNVRQLPAGPQLQVNPRQDLLKFRGQQEQALESYSWENKEDGTVRVPIERAMDILLKQGLPVAPGATSAETSPQSSQAEKSLAKGSENR
jgi:hypothetical protein